VEMTHEEMDALLQRYDGLPVPMQAMIDSDGLEAGGGADASDSE